MNTSAEKIRTFAGPALLSYGFRIFFLGGAVWGAIAVAVWPAMLTGSVALPTALSPLHWHVHAMLYGFLPAVAAGFLLTAVPNWTGRFPVQGTPLLALFLIWVAGRAAVLTSQLTGLWIAAAIDLAFPAALVAVIAREIIAGNNLRNLRVLVLIGLLLVGDAVFFAEAHSGTFFGYGTRLGIAAAVILLSLIGGRIIPSFTRNWLARQSPGRLPIAFNSYDVVSILISAAALALWVAMPDEVLTAGALFVAGAFQTLRICRWAGDRTLAEPLLVVLHVGYAFVPLGFFLVCLSILAPSAISTSGALHGWTAGAIGLMTLAVMTRASLGHTGRPLHANRATQAIYVLAFIAAAARLAAAFGVAYMPMLYLSATAWVLAFGGFAIVYGPILVSARR